jgi:hypothetical protein
MLKPRRTLRASRSARVPCQDADLRIGSRGVALAMRVGAEMAVVLVHAEKLGIDAERRLLGISFSTAGPVGLCLRGGWADVDHPQCKALTLHIPRTKFVEFLQDVPRGTEEVYVIPRGLLEYNTTWSEPKMTTYRRAWHLLQGTSPELFGRRFAHLGPWVRRLISGLEARDIPYQLVRSEKGKKLTKAGYIFKDDCWRTDADVRSTRPSTSREPPLTH